jgi:hypothetical protein
MAFEPRWQPILDGFAQPLVGGDETHEQRHHKIQARYSPVRDGACKRSSPGGPGSLGVSRAQLVGI